MLRRVFPLLRRPASGGTERDKAGNRWLLNDQCVALLFAGLFNPAPQSARALVASKWHATSVTLRNPAIPSERNS